MKLTRLALIAAAATGLATGANAATLFNLDTSTLNIGSGYGSGSNRLDVDFDFLLGNPSQISLNVGQSVEYNFIQADLNTSNINSNQTDNLGVSVNLVFSLPTPISGGQTVSYIAVTGAVTGSVSDNANDYWIEFSPQTVNFGNGGQFRIEAGDLYFDEKEEKSNKLKITLLADSSPLTGPGTTIVPEPGTLALLGTALLGFAGIRRRRR